LKGFKSKNLEWSRQYPELYEAWIALLRDVRRLESRHKKPCVIKEWRDFGPFRIFAACSGYQTGQYLDRIDPNGIFEPSNARWVEYCTSFNLTEKDLKPRPTITRKKLNGASKQRLYTIWKGMCRRCTDDNCKDWHDYGGRGIKVCEDWKANYFTFREWAMAHGYRDDMSIDRIDVNGNYCPENCRWAGELEQMLNKRGSEYINIRLTTSRLKRLLDDMPESVVTLIARRDCLPIYAGGIIQDDYGTNEKGETT
jgi:hypothetical protein